MYCLQEMGGFCLKGYLNQRYEVNERRLIAESNPDEMELITKTFTHFLKKDAD